MFAITKQSKRDKNLWQSYNKRKISGKKSGRKKMKMQKWQTYASRVSQLHWSAPPRSTCLHWQNKQ